MKMVVGLQGPEWNEANDTLNLGAKLKRVIKRLSNQIIF